MFNRKSDYALNKLSPDVELYTKDVRPRLKENTWLTKENIIQKKILPYFGKRKISEITTKDVIAWQNELLAYRDDQRKPYSQTYLKTLHNQLSAIFNHAVRFYDLRSNPAAKAGNMGTEERKEKLIVDRLCVGGGHPVCQKCRLPFADMRRGNLVQRQVFEERENTMLNEIPLVLHGVSLARIAGCPAPRVVSVNASPLIRPRKCLRNWRSVV